MYPRKNLYRSPFNHDGSRASKFHSDVCGPMNVRSIGGSRYMVTFVDDFTRRFAVYTLSNTKISSWKVQGVWKSCWEQCLEIKKLITGNGGGHFTSKFLHAHRDQLEELLETSPPPINVHIGQRTLRLKICKATKRNISAGCIKEDQSQSWGSTASRNTVSVN